MTQANKLTDQQHKTFNSLANRYPAVRAMIATRYIYATEEEIGETRREFAKMLASMFPGDGDHDKIAYFLEFQLEVAELRAIETLRPRDWPDLARIVHQMDMLAPIGGE